ncbi:MAG TPA: S8/S53 family peptidase [Candidatus Limnocylindrales bacterium]|nr:S8/S53 family peptidase [Candidatus Limnocylindrales bacterium]
MRTLRTALTASIAVLFVAGLTLAGSPSIAIETVDGQPAGNGSRPIAASGTVEVTGTAALGTPSGGTDAEPSPLIADAGDSPFVATGGRALLLGAAWGGSEPYSYAWTSPVGSFVEGQDGATALLDTTGVAPGHYSATLTVRDGTGGTASDAVIVVVAPAATVTLLDDAKDDLLPGASLGAPALMTFLEFPFEVPAGLSSFEAEVTWTNPANDYDLHVFDPNGVEQDYSGNGATNLVLQFEAGGVAGPQPGTWTLALERFLTATDTVHATAVGRAQEPDPRPVVSAGGPYRFEIGATQRLDGSVEGGAAPVDAAWDLDNDGRFEAQGAAIAPTLAAGHHLVTLKATDADGLERRQTTSVLVADAARLAEDTTALTVIGVADSGVNPYHLEFSATTYPDPDVLALTREFTRHPSEYLPGYPPDAQALPITTGQGYFPAQDRNVFDQVELGRMYWIPGTKIIGAVDANDSSASNAAADATPILDDDGHGTGSASVSTGNRYGYCPTCLLFFVEGLDESVATAYPFVDITSHSFGYIGGAPVGPIVGPNEATRTAAERGQITLFAAGNGVGNAFDVPQLTYGSDQTGASWNITVGAIRRDSGRAIVGDGIPADISAWGDGNLPSACRTGTVGQCAFGGTSAATPYTAGIFGTVLTEVRRAIGDQLAGQRPGQVVAEGLAIQDSVYLEDGRLTRSELREAVLKTAFPLNQDNEPSTFPYPLTAPYLGEANVLFEGYGAATPEGARRAVDVILGRALVPDRSFEDDFFALDQAVKDTLYGGYDRDGDGDTDFVGLAGTSITPASVATVSGTMAALGLAADALSVEPSLDTPAGQNALTYYLHRRFVAEPGKTPSCSADDNESYLDTADTPGDLECFENRITSVAAAYRPLGIYAAAETLDAPVPAGSDVYATIYVAAENPSVVRPTGVLMATDREIGSGPGALQPVLGTGTGSGSNIQGNPVPAASLCATAGELCWTKFDLSFETTRPAFAGEPLTFQIQLIGARAWAFGHEGAHASKVAIVPAALPDAGLDFGVTIDEPGEGSRVPSGSSVIAGGRFAFPDPGTDPSGAGDHPTTRRVEVSLDDASFGSATEASLDEAGGTWSAPLGTLADGEHTVYARARLDTTTSEVASVTFTVGPDARVEWQVVARNGPTDPAAWQAATGVEAWRFAFEASSVGSGPHTIVTRLVSDGLEVARATAKVRLE